MVVEEKHLGDTSTECCAALMCVFRCTPSFDVADLQADEVDVGGGSSLFGRCASLSSFIEKCLKKVRIPRATYENMENGEIIPVSTKLIHELEKLLIHIYTIGNTSTQERLGSLRLPPPMSSGPHMNPILRIAALEQDELLQPQMKMSYVGISRKESF